MAARLEALVEISDQKFRTEQYKTVLAELIGSGDEQGCQSFVSHMLSDKVPLVMARTLLQAFISELKTLPTDAQKTLASYALERMQPRVVSFEEQVAAIREKLADLYEEEEEWSKAAVMLAGIDLDSGMRQLDNEYKLAKNIKIAMLFLEDDDAVNAETYIKKASQLLSGNKVLELQYKTCYARILDSKRRFLEAATRYYELSQQAKREVGGFTIDEADLEHALEAAVTCVILAPPGPQRSRVLAQLYKDERCARLTLFPFLEKVYMERILRKEEVEAFAKTLKEHQVAALPDGGTVLERAVMEHNVAAAAKLYYNIYIEELGPLLGVPADKAEQIATRMISEKRLTGSVDQVSGLISFSLPGGDAELRGWDEQIQGVCHSLNAIVDSMASKGIKFEIA